MVEVNTAFQNTSLPHQENANVFYLYLHMYLTNISAWTKINVCSKHPNNGKFHVLCIYDELNSFSYANIFLQSYPLLIVMMVHTKAWSQLLKKGRLEISWVVMVIHQKEHLLHRGRPLPLFLNASVPPRHSDCLR